MAKSKDQKRREALRRAILRGNTNPHVMAQTDHLRAIIQYGKGTSPIRELVKKFPGNPEGDPDHFENTMRAFGAYDKDPELEQARSEVRSQWSLF